MEGSQGDNVSMVVNTSRLPSPVVAWYKDEEPIVCNSHLEISQDPDHCKLMVSNVTPADSGTYKCVASSVMGTITKKFLLNIEGKLVPCIDVVYSFQQHSQNVLKELVS